MQYRPFGTTGLLVSEIGFGCLRLAGTSIERKDRKEVLKTLGEALDSGVNFFDTADMYGQGRSEELLGEALRGRRSGTIVATKAGYVLSRFGTFAAALKPYVRPFVRALPSMNKSVAKVRSSAVAQDFSNQYLTTAIDCSLRRLRTDYIDLFQLHNPPASALESGEFCEAVEKAKAAGKIRWCGVSCRRPEDAELCFRYTGIAAVQIEINVLNLAAASTVVSNADAQHVAVIAREPLASGALLSSVADDRTTASCSVSRNGTAETALQTVLRIGGVSVVIVGMSSRAHLRENLKALRAAA